MHERAFTIDFCGETQTVAFTRAQDPGKAGELEEWADQLAGSYYVLATDTVRNTFK